MAEVVGVVSGLVGLVTFAAKITRLSYDIFTDLSSASRTQQQYLQEVSALTDVLFRARDAAAQSEDLDINLGSTRPLSLADDVLDDCLAQLSLICDSLSGGIKRAKWLLKEKELRKNIDQLQRYHAIFSEYVSAHTLATATATYRKVDTLSADVDDMGKEMKRKELIDWIDMAEETSKPMPIATPGTGSWFLDTEQYRQWQEAEPCLFWCSGAPGAGKSVIASLVVEVLMNGNTTACVAYYFCDHATRTQQTTTSILKSLLFRLALQLDSDTINALVQFKRGVRVEANATLLEEMVALASKHCTVMIVFDAIDELGPSADVIPILESLVSRGCRSLVTSRELQDIKSQLPVAISMTIAANPADIKTFLEAQFREADQEDLVRRGQDLIDKIIKRADGRFLLAQALVRKLVELPTLAQMRKSLKSMPSTISEAFEADLHRIQSQPPARRHLALKLISWVTQSKRRLKANELIHALAIDEDDEVFDEDNIPNLTLALRTCVGLVVEEPRDGSIGMVHITAYEFFQAQSLEFTESYIAASCLRYLISSPLASGPCWESSEMKRRIESRPFLLYAAKFWGGHILNPEVEQQVLPLVKVLLDNHPLRTASFQALHYRETLPDSLATELLRAIPTDQTALHVAAFWNLRAVTSNLLLDSPDLSAQDSQQWTPLHYACRTATDSRSILDLLLDAGSEVNARDSQGWTPLFQLVLNDNVEAIKTLLSHGASHLARDKHGWSPLTWAVSAYQQSVVEAILQHHGRWLKAQKATSQALVRDLTYAEACEHLDLYHMDDTGMQLVLATGSVGFTRLFKSLRTGSPRTLWPTVHFDVPVSNIWRTTDKAEMTGDFEGCLDLHAHSRPGQSKRAWQSRLLHRAIRDSNFMAVRLLIDLGTDVNYDIGLTSLHVAAFRADSKYAKLLLQFGADVSIRDKRDRTALHQAVLNGFVDTASELIKGGADVDAKIAGRTPGRTPGRMPLIIACGLRPSSVDGSNIVQLQMLDLLLANKANSDLKDGNGMTALHHATKLRRCDLVARLTAAGCNVHLRDNEGRTALHMAMRYANLEVVQVLVDAGSDIYAVDKESRRMIHYLADSAFNSNISTDELRRVLLLIQADGPPHYNVEWVHSETQAGIFIPGLDGNYSHRQRRILHTPSSLCLRAKNWALFEVLQEQDALLPPGYDLEPHLVPVVQQARYASMKALLSMGVRFHEKALSPHLGTKWKIFLRDLERPGEHVLKFLKLLVESGCDLRQATDKDTSLGLALVSHFDSFEMTQSLLDWGLLDPRHKNASRLDACALSALNRKYANLACLLDRLDESVPSSKMLSSDELGAADVLQRYCSLLNSQSTNDDSNSVDSQHTAHSSLLFSSVEFGNSELLKELLRQGLDPNTMDSSGWRPIHLASFEGNESAIRMLLLAGANVDARVLRFNKTIAYSPRRISNRIWRGTALHLAAMRGFLNIADLLIGADADVNRKVKRGNQESEDEEWTLHSPSHGPTALHLTLVTKEQHGFGILSDPLSEDRLLLAEMLVRNGADVSTAADHIRLADVVKFKDHQNLWDKLRAGISQNGEPLWHRDDNCLLAELRLSHCPS